MKNIINKFFLFLTIIAALASLTGCATYRASALNSLAPHLTSTISNSQQGVAIVAKKFSKSDCKKYLGRDVLKKGYQPVQLFIQNNTEKSFSFCLYRISLPQVNSEEVAKSVHTSTAGRATGYGIGSLILWPLVFPAVIDGVMSSKANKALNIDFETKAAKDQIIYPYSYVNTIIFIPKATYTNNFSITLIDQETNQPLELHAFASHI